MATYPVSVVYDDQECSFNLNAILLSKIEVTTNPTKMAYHTGETMDYSGAVITATYDDESTADVTSSCIFTPAAGEDFESSVEIVYAEGQDEQTCFLTLTEITLQRIYVDSQPTKTAYESGEAIDYTGLVVKAVYSDETEEDVTSDCTIIPAAGKEFDPSTDTEVIITYGDAETSLILSEKSSSMWLNITTMPTKTTYHTGEKADYRGIVIKATHLDGTTHTVTDFCDFDPASGSDAAETVTVSCAYPEAPYVFDLNTGWINNGVWTPENPTQTYADIYQVQANHKYLLAFGENVGTRFRAMFTTADVSQATAKVTGTAVINTNNPAAYASVEYTAPSNGFIVVAKDNIGKSDIVTYLYDANAAGKPVTTDFTLTVIDGEWDLYVETMPKKIVFADGENLDYTGLVIRAMNLEGESLSVLSACELDPASGTPAKANNPTESDESVVSYDPTVTVSVRCAKPTEPDIFDLTGGYVSYGTWYIYTAMSVYNDIYSVVAGHKYFLTFGNSKGNYFNAMFSTVDVSQASEGVSGNRIEQRNGTMEYTPPADGFIVVSKSINTAGIKTYLFDAETKSLSTEFDIEVKVIDSIEITQYPTKTAYYSDERINYDGLTVALVYSDGTREEDITDLCTLSSAAGKVFDPATDTQIVVTYSIPSGSGSMDFTEEFELTPILLSSISVTSSPRIMVYKAGETIYYDNLAVTAYYDDGSTKDVTNLCTITPAAEKAFDPLTDTDVLISYSEQGTNGLITETANLTLTAIELTGISVTQNPHKMGYSQDEPIDYAGLVVTASYSDGSTEDVTNLCTITPADGKAFDPATDTDVEIGYEGQTASIFLTEKYLTGIEITHNPYRTAYKENEKISYNGMVVTANYSDESTFVVTRKCRMTPASGKRFDPEEDTNVEITYAGMSCSLMLTPVLLTGLEVTQRPNKMEYFAGEAIDYTGIVVSGVYSDGSKEYVTEDCTFSPEAGTTFSSETEVTITYQEQTCGLTLTAVESEARLLVSKLPEKTGYKRGDTISYKGTKVQAAYAGDVETAANYVGGIEIQATYADGTVHTVTDYCSFSPAEGSTINADTEVTVSCAEPMDPYAFDITNGCVENYGTWRYSQDESCRSDIYRVTAGHRYLIAMGAAEAFVYRVLFTTQDLTTATSTVSGGTAVCYRSKSTYDGEGPQSYTPSSNGYLVITKSISGTSGIKTYLYDANSQNKALTTSFYLTVGELASISVTQPVKARYRVGEAFDYTGVIVSAKFTDGHIENVTEDALFSPPNGTTATSDSPTQQVYTQVTVGYHSKYACFHMLTTGIAMMSLRVDTPPNKIFYYPGEKLDYSGLTATVVYWNGREKDVTRLVTFDPPNGTTPGEYRSLDGNTQVVTISYEETDESLVSNIGDVETVSGMDVGEDFDAFDSYKSFSHGWVVTEEVSYFNITSGEVKTVAFTYYETDGLGCFDYPEYNTLTLEDVRSYEEYQREENEWLEAHGYTGRWRLNQETVTLYDGVGMKNRQFGYETSVYAAYYEDTDLYYFCPIAEGFRGYLPPSTSFHPLFQVSYGADASYDINLSVLGLESLAVTKMPTKTVYSYGELVDTTGWEVTAYYTDGTMVDVSSKVQLDEAFASDGVGTWPKVQDKYYDSKKKGYNVPIEYKNSKAIVDGKEVYINGARKATGSFFISYTG